MEVATVLTHNPWSARSDRPRGRAPSRGRGLALLGVGAMLFASAPALAQQDSDSDGVLDSADPFPCDSSRAAVSWFPGETTSALLTYEDQWPDATDADFNDVALRAHYRVERNAAGATRRARR
jgi:hypothetical protein